MRTDRRRILRVDTRLTTFLTDPTSGKVRRALTRNIGAGGLCVVTEEAMELGTAVRVEVKLPDREQPVACEAVVIWSQSVADSSGGRQVEVESGLQFVSINPKDRTMLQYYAKLNPPPPAS